MAVNAVNPRNPFRRLTHLFDIMGLPPAGEHLYSIERAD